MQKLVQVLACVLVFGTSVLVRADEGLWKRVQRLDSGSRVTVTVQGEPAVQRYLVRLTDTDGN